jgi:hypothetical protein
LLTGLVDTTVGRTAGSSSLLQPDKIATKSNVIMGRIFVVCKKLNNFIFLFFRSREKKAD